MGGSLRLPAHYTGVFGHKTTFGIVPRYGHIPPIPGQLPPEVIPAIPLSVVGPLARSADDLELALDVLTTSIDLDETDQKHELLPPRRRQFSDYRVAMWFTDSFPAAEIDFDVLETLKKAVEKLRASGLEIDEEARPDISLAENTAIWRDIYSRLQLAVSPLPEDLVSRQKRQQALWAEFFERYDVLLAPVAPTVAFPHDHEGTLPSRSFVVNGQKKPMLNNLT